MVWEKTFCSFLADGASKPGLELDKIAAQVFAIFLGCVLLLWFASVVHNFTISAMFLAGILHVFLLQFPAALVFLFGFPWHFALATRPNCFAYNFLKKGRGDSLFCCFPCCMLESGPVPRLAPVQSKYSEKQNSFLMLSPNLLFVLMVHSWPSRGKGNF